MTRGSEQRVSDSRSAEQRENARKLGIRAGNSFGTPECVAGRTTGRSPKMPVPNRCQISVFLRDFRCRSLCERFRVASQIPLRGVASIALGDVRFFSLRSPDFVLSSFSHVGNAGSTPAGITNQINGFSAIDGGPGAFDSHI